MPLGRGAEDNLNHEIVELSKLNHPHIVRILAYTHGNGEDSSQDGPKSWLLVMDYCETDLKALQEDSTLMRDERRDSVMLRLLTQVALGMEYIHSKDKTHLDIKPENVLVANVGSADEPQWSARVADFVTTKKQYVSVGRPQSHP